MKDYDVLNELVPKTQELHRAIFDKGYEQGQKDILEQLRYDDCISKQAVLKILKNNRYRFNISQEGNCEGKVLWSEKLIKDDACAEIEQLPLIMPTKKTGWSIVHGVVSNKFWCSSCGYIEIMDNSMNDWNYCPICGAAKMEVNE